MLSITHNDLPYLLQDMVMVMDIDSCNHNSLFVLANIQINLYNCSLFAKKFNFAHNKANKYASFMILHRICGAL